MMTNYDQEFEKLKIDFENGKRTIQDLSIEEIEKLSEHYRKEIETNKRDIENTKRKIKNLKNKIDNII